MLVVTAQIEALEGARHLHHDGKLKMLRLDVVIVCPVEATNRLLNRMTDLLTQHTEFTMLYRVGTKRILRKGHCAR